MLRLFNIILFFMFSCVSISNAASMSVSEEEAKIWAETKGQELILAIGETDQNKKFAKLDNMLINDINLDYVSKFVVGKYYRQMNDQQKIRYRNVFERYALSLYKLSPIRFDPTTIKYTIEKITVHNNFTTVICNLNLGKFSSTLDFEKIPVIFKLIKINNKIQTVDVEISDVSLVIEYRKQFYKIINEQGQDINWFIDILEDKVYANESALGM